MDYKLIISPTVFKKLSGEDGNIDADKVASSIFRAQTMYLQAILGTDLMDKIIADNISGSLVGKYSTLYNSYIVPGMVEWVLYMLRNKTSFQLTNKGSIKPTSERSEVSDTSELNRVEAQDTNFAEFWSQRIVNYCCEYSSDLPEYNDNNTLDKVKPEGTQYNGGGIYFPDNSYRRNNKGSRWH